MDGDTGDDGDTGITGDTGSGIANLYPYAVRDGVDSVSGGGQSFTATPITVNLDNEIYTDSNYSLSSDEITIVAAGMYLISFTVGFETDNGANNGSVLATMQSNESGSFAVIQNSRCSRQYRVDAGYHTAQQTFLHKTSAANVELRLRVRRGTGSSTLVTVRNRQQVSIIRVE